MKTRNIVVGVDGSAPSWDALHWAVGEAHRWRAALRVLFVDNDRGPATPRTSGSCLAQMVADARRLEPWVRITGEVGHGEVVPVLRQASYEALMVVVGRRRHGGLARLLTGSTSLQIASQAPVPVAVVHGDVSSRAPIVVGVDGSTGSEDALGTALDEARLRGCPVVSVLAYSYHIHPWLTDGRPPPSDPQLLHASAYAALESTVAPWREKFPDISIRTTVAATPPVSFLTDLSHHAQLVVIGAHGQDYPAGPLGSVPERLLHRAHCPVLIAR